ncbi:acetyl-coenzyme A synthetase [Halobacteriovorax marinus SJ]|uniref:Acetate--CoA ligase n=1 Tax=Halobacteriovorax marinus (strain ATCC BAA-682 / DSM 15412 / SJ) TaxID=862908 RepID=E1WXR5_HALMS|nr:acetate--CoA ligase [Halobacteriovorax marinus]CBW25871.1 acetyl-coenzyme A synthetase [Halobacteriovorax marinus SJ]
MDWKIKSLEEYALAYQESRSNPELYWGKVADTFKWNKKWESVLSGSIEDANIKWFDGAELNITENCLDRHLEERGDKVALIYEPNDPNEPALEYTYKQLHTAVCKTANMLKAQGVEKGDRVCLYMSMVPELMISVLACARIGAIHSVVFGGFSAHALAGRIEDCDCKILITNDAGHRGEKIIHLKDIADKALDDLDNSPVQKVIVHKRVGNDIEMKEGRDLWWHDLYKEASSDYPSETMQAEDPLFILYTSGSTGKPKGVLHTTAGYMVWAAYTFGNVFQMNEEDRYWCTADIGWITGHTYLTYGPLLNGVTTTMFEGIPTFPNPGRFWEVVDKHKITHFYTAPTAVRALMACDPSFVTNNNLDSLKVLGSVGEPINAEAWHWYNKSIGKEKCPIVDTWWQTETGGILISSLAGVTEGKPCFATLPLPGVFPALMDAEGKVIEERESEGNLCITRPWPGMLRSIWGDHERFKQTYLSAYPGSYFTGDGCKRDADGLYRITGRVDDVLNVSGHRIGTAEVENAIGQHPDVIESAIVGFPHDIKGQGIYAYVIASENHSPEEMREEILKVITEEIGPIAKPDKIQIVPGLPKTRSGKIMRRILRKIAAKEFDNFGDTSTLLDPSIVDKIKDGAL